MWVGPNKLIYFCRLAKSNPHIRYLEHNTKGKSYNLCAVSVLGYQYINTLLEPVLNHSVLVLR